MFKSLSNTSGPVSVVMNNSLARGKIFRLASSPCQQEANDYFNDLTNCKALGQCSPGGIKYKGYMGCASFGLPEAVKIANQIVAGAGTVVMGVFGLAGAPPIALALSGAALFNVEVMSIVTQIDVAAALKNVNNAASYKAMHQAVDETESMLKDFLLGLVIPETEGFIKDIYTGLSEFIQAFENTETLTPNPSPVTYTGGPYTVSASRPYKSCNQTFNMGINITVTWVGSIGTMSLPTHYWREVIGPCTLTGIIEDFQIFKGNLTGSNSTMTGSAVTTFLSGGGSFDATAEFTGSVNPSGGITGTLSITSLIITQSVSVTLVAQ
jgi:hypothetical protein